MFDDPRPTVLPVIAFTNLDDIDGGNTVVLRFTSPDGREVALLVPKRAISELRRAIADQVMCDPATDQSAV
ncbi:hypothetical protein [Methylobacterium sp. Leaf466]|uniref:hypothetical protein n=1 Tax=Methylobacterium sp. Leaf466 TaxID=1736386 RepID=UPI000A94F123|nr:hypothetical protein [Methylobacterium sp. Leaf466]